MKRARACTSVRSARRQLARRGLPLGVPPVVIDEPYLYDNRWLSTLRREMGDKNADEFIQDISRTSQTEHRLH